MFLTHALHKMATDEDNSLSKAVLKPKTETAKFEPPQQSNFWNDFGVFNQYLAQYPSPVPESARKKACGLYPHGHFSPVSPTVGPQKEMYASETEALNNKTTLGDAAVADDGVETALATAITAELERQQTSPASTSSLTPLLGVLELQQRSSTSQSKHEVPATFKAIAQSQHQMPFMDMSGMNEQLPLPLPTIKITAPSPTKVEVPKMKPAKRQAQTPETTGVQHLEVPGNRFFTRYNKGTVEAGRRDMAKPKP